MALPDRPLIVVSLVERVAKILLEPFWRACDVRFQGTFKVFENFGPQSPLTLPLNRYSHDNFKIYYSSRLGARILAATNKLYLFQQKFLSQY